VNKDG
jgi:hypothetical protein